MANSLWEILPHKNIDEPLINSSQSFQQDVPEIKSS